MSVTDLSPTGSTPVFPAPIGPCLGDCRKTGNRSPLSEGVDRVTVALTLNGSIQVTWWGRCPHCGTGWYRVTEAAS